MENNRCWIFDFFNPSKGIFNEEICKYINITKKFFKNFALNTENKKFYNPYNNLYIYKSVRQPRCLHSDTI